MRARVLAFVAALALCSAPLAGCRSPKTPAESIANLKHSDPTQRQHAADELRTDHGVPPEAIQPLMRALETETVPKVTGAILITLGRSGVPEAKPLIDKQVQAALDPDMRRWAGRALKYWMIATRQMPEAGPWPNAWPYGQPGYPPKIQGE